MWLKCEEGSLINLAYARRIYRHVSGACNQEIYFLIVETGDTEITLRKFPDARSADHFLWELQVELNAFHGCPKEIT